MREHLYGTAKSCDHWHDDAGFLTHHIGTWQFEKSLRLVDPSTTSHYWDYTRRTRGRELVGKQHFWGRVVRSCNPSDPDHIVNVGRWAYTPVMKDARSFSNITIVRPTAVALEHESNAVPHALRASWAAGDKNRDFLRALACICAVRIHDVGGYSPRLNGGLHGPVHLMTGGQWNTQIHDMALRLQRKFPRLFPAHVKGTVAAGSYSNTFLLLGRHEG